MITHMTLLEKIERHEKIYLCSKTRVKAILFAAFAFILTGLAYELYLFLNEGMNSLGMMATAFFSAGLLFLLISAWKVSATAYIKGELMIVRFLSGMTKVTGLESVRKIKSLRIAGIQFTTLQFFIDGRTFTIIMYGKPHFTQDTRTIIETARKTA